MKTAGLVPTLRHDCEVVNRSNGTNEENIESQRSRVPQQPKGQHDSRVEDKYHSLKPA